MANIAFVFTWGPEVMDPMPVSELMRWHEKALKRRELDQKQYR